jgi:enoyl-CoA hydratase/carnithine racemase
VVEITLDQPAKHNPLSDAAARELTDALERAQNDDSVRVVLLTGAGESFSAGGDIEEFSEQMERRATELFEEGKASARLFKLLAGYEKPLVGAINGSAFGGGCGLVAACDLTYASDRAQFGTTEITLGLFPMVILPALRATLGDQKTLELALTGTRIDADEAADIGLVTETVADADVLDRARETARELAGRSPLALTLGLHAFNETAGMSAERAIETLNAYRVLFYKSHDLKEGADAFLEDRDPDWKGV